MTMVFSNNKHCHIWGLRHETCKLASTLHRSTFVSRKLLLWTVRFCWSKVSRPMCPCCQQLVHSDQRDDAKVLLNDAPAPELWQFLNQQHSKNTAWSQNRKKHSSTHTHPDHQPPFISFLHLLRSIASSLFNLRTWQFLHNLSKSSRLSSTPWSGIVCFILHIFLHQIIVFVLQHMPIQLLHHDYYYLLVVTTTTTTTTTATTTTILQPSGFCPEQPGWASTRKVKPGR